MESLCQELSNATRLDIGSARGAEDRSKLFPIMCVIFTFLQVLQVYISVFRHESVMEKIAKNTLLKKIFSLTRERWGRIPYTPPRRCAPHRGDTPHTPRAPRVCFSIFRYFFPTLKILDVLNSTRNYNFFFEIFLYFFCEIFKFQNPLFGGNFRPKCFRTGALGSF